jgi:hypothetical protein
MNRWQNIQLRSSTSVVSIGHTVYINIPPTLRCKPSCVECVTTPTIRRIHPLPFTRVPCVWAGVFKGLFKLVLQSLWFFKVKGKLPPLETGTCQPESFDSATVSLFSVGVSGILNLSFKYRSSRASLIGRKNCWERLPPKNTKSLRTSFPHGNQENTDGNY